MPRKGIEELTGSTGGAGGSSSSSSTRCPEMSAALGEMLRVVRIFGSSDAMSTYGGEADLLEHPAFAFLGKCEVLLADQHWCEVVRHPETHLAFDLPSLVDCKTGLKLCFVNAVRVLCTAKVNTSSSDASAAGRSFRSGRQRKNRRVRRREQIPEEEDTSTSSINTAAATSPISKSVLSSNSRPHGSGAPSKPTGKAKKYYNPGKLN